MTYNTPKRIDFLPFNQYSFDEREKNAVLEVLESAWITTGPKTKQFEKEFAEYIGCKHAIALNSCTAGLHLSLLANDIGIGDEVIVPDITFTSTANIVVHTGGRPIIVDVDPTTLNIDPQKIEEKITKNTKAIIPVHLAGQPCDMDAINKIAEKYNLIVIEDAAHATESFYKGKKVGNMSQLTAFSFYATKNITTAEGGMLTTNDDQLAEKIRVLSLHGLSKDAWKRYSNEGYKHYDVVCAGYKYNMTDIQSALGIEQLKKIDKFADKRKEHKKTYDQLLSDVPEISFVKEIDNIVHARHLYMVMLDMTKLKVTRDQIMDMMIQQNIGVSVHFMPLHLHTYYKERFNLLPENFPVATKASKSLLSLPFYPNLKKEDIIYVCQKLRDIIEEFKI